MKWVNSKLLLIAILCLPGVIMTARYLMGSLYYGEYIHATGEFSARLLIITLAATPLRRLFASASWSRWLLLNRRYFGIATFAYAVPHLLAYLYKLASVAEIVEQAAEPGMLTGWIAMIIFLILAITSNNTSVRRLGRRWKTLHRFVYLAAVMTFAHWVLVAFNPIPGFVHAGVLFVLVIYRVVSSTQSAAKQ